MKLTTYEMLRENPTTPRVAKVQLCTGHDYLTWAGECSCDRSAVAYQEKFVVVGVPYGHVHTSGGDWRFWKTRSGAAKFLKNYLADRV